MRKIIMPFIAASRHFSSLDNLNTDCMVALETPRREHWNVNKDIGKIILCPVISKSYSLVVERSLRNLRIGDSNTGANYFHFQYRIEKILFFSPRNAHYPYNKSNTWQNYLFCFFSMNHRTLDHALDTNAPLTSK